jgi:hypothetical protein
MRMTLILIIMIYVEEGLKGEWTITVELKGI